MKNKCLFVAFLLVFLFMLSVANAAEINDDSLHLEKIGIDDTNNNEINLKTDASNNNTCWYVDGNVSDSGNGHVNAPYKTLKEAVDNSCDGDTIYIAPGVYTRFGNVNLEINKKLGLSNLNNGTVIFDGENRYSMFKFTTDSINITGLTFRNAVGFGHVPIWDEHDGILFFKNGLKNSVIKANFIANKISYCGVITSTGDIDGVDFNCTFINNEGGFYEGSLIYAWNKAIRNSNINCYTLNNLIFNNFFKANGIYGVNIDVVSIKNRAKRAGLTFVLDENRYSNSTCTITKRIVLDSIKVYAGKSNNVNVKNCFYVDEKVLKSGNGLFNAPFKSLKEAINKANDGDIIYIAPGIYKGLNNTCLEITKKLTLARFGNGDVIFDGEGKNTMFLVRVDSLNIIDLTFKNGLSHFDCEEGLISLKKGLKNSLIRANFIDNVIQCCGVFTTLPDIEGADFDCKFINNKGRLL